MQLDFDNYYTRDMNMAYMSVSQFKAFQACESAALAELTGQYRTEPTGAMLVGSYVDAHFSGEMDTFKTTHPELFKKDGSLKSEFVQADSIIARIERDDMMRTYLAGQHQVVMTGLIADIPFKIRIDSYHADKVIVDLKVMRDFKPIWKHGTRMHWIEAWGYDIQGAVYQAVEGHSLPFIIAAASKEDTTDISLLGISDHHLSDCLHTVKALAPRFDQIKKGLVEPTRCETCAWCRQTKIITSVLDYTMEDYE